MATAQHTRPRAVVGAPRRAAGQLKSALRHSISAAPRTIIFLHFFAIIAGDFFFTSTKSTMQIILQLNLQCILLKQ